jgi:hypothetical protein
MNLVLEIFIDGFVEIAFKRKANTHRACLSLERANGGAPALIMSTPAFGPFSTLSNSSKTWSPNLRRPGYPSASHRSHDGRARSGHNRCRCGAATSTSYVA